MAKKPTNTSRDLLAVTWLLMRSFQARMRQGERRLEPAHVGILARTSIARERELTHRREQRAAERRALPWVRVDKNYVFDTPEGRRTLAWMKRDAERHVARMLADLAAADRAQVDAGLKILLETLRLNVPTQ